MNLRSVVSRLRAEMQFEAMNIARAINPAGFPDWPAQYQGIPTPLSANQMEFPRAVAAIPMIYSCIDMLANDAAGLPLKFYKLAKGSKRTIIEPEPENVAGLWDRMNPVQSRFESVVEVQQSLDSGGMGYLFHEKYGSEKPTRDWELWPMPAQTLKPIAGEHRRMIGYEFAGSLSPVTFAPDAVLFFRYWHPDFTPVGMSPLESARIQYETSFLAGRFNRQFYESNGSASGAFSIDGDANLKPGEIDAMKKQLYEQTKGPKNAFHPLLMQGVKFERRGLTHQEMAFIETAGLTDSAICLVYGIPPSRQGIHSAKSSGSQSGGQSKDADEVRYWTFTQKKRSDLRDAVVTKHLCRYWGPDVFAETDYSGVPALQDMYLTQVKALVIASGGPILSVNEARIPVPNLDPLPDPEHDEIREPKGVGSASSTATSDGMDDTGDNPDGTGEVDIKDEPKAESKAESAPRRSRSELLEQRVAERRRSGATLARYRRRFERAIRAFFTSQEAEALGRLELAYQMAGFDTTRGIRFANGNGKRLDPSINIDHLLGPDNEPDIDRLRQIFEDLIVERGAEQLSELGVELEIALSEAFGKRYAERYAAELVSQINDTTRSRLTKALAEVIANSGTYHDAAAAVRSAFDDRRANADTIARTEMIGAYNASSLEAARQSGVVTGKDWMSAEDELVRDTHKACESQGVIGLEERFSNGLLFPGDPDGDAGEVCNCRCSLTFKVDEARVAQIKATYRRTLQRTTRLPDVPLLEWLEGACVK